MWSTIRALFTRRRRDRTPAPASRQQVRALFRADATRYAKLVQPDRRKRRRAGRAIAAVGHRRLNGQPARLPAATATPRPAAGSTWLGRLVARLRAFGA